MRPRLHVFILTYCRKLELLYGSELIFRTLRVGFPTARVTVVDNASLAAAKPRLAALAREHGCEFRALAAPGVEHADFLEGTLREVAEGDGGTVVFLDPDICLWGTCEGWTFDALLAGKRVDAYDDDMLQAVSMPRVHTSFLWVPDARRLRDEIGRIRAAHFDFRPFLSFSVKLGDAWIRYDTGASLFAAVRERVAFFTPAHRDRYDHIYCGSHLDLLEPRMSQALRELTLTTHRHAREGNLAALQGIWRQQERVWAEVYRKDT